MRKIYTIFAALIALPVLTTGGIAGEADVVDAKITQSSAGSYGFDVSVRHADTGWKHYADRWEVLDPDRNILATRVLVHPHENEQPFTRSLSGVKIPVGIGSVILRAHDSVHAYGGKEITVEVPR